MAVMGPRPRAEPRTNVSSKLKAKVVTKGFDQGQVDPRVHHRTDAPQIRAAAKEMRNWAIVTGGSAARRPGSENIFTSLVVASHIAADTRIEHVSFGPDLDRIIRLSAAGVVNVYELDGAEEDSAAAAFLTASNIHTLQMVVLDDMLVLTSRDFYPQQISRNPSTGQLTIADFAFAEGADGSTLQPYFRYAARGITLQPSALTGSITLELGPGTPSHFTADHVGAILRYHGKEIEITAVTDGDTATGTVLAPNGLFPTHNVTVDSSAAFAAGDPIQGNDSGVEATVVSVTNATTIVVIYEGYSTFDVTGGETIVGPGGYAVVSASTVTTTAASVQWDEAMISDFAGYPGGCVIHKGRLGFLDFPKAQSWITLSAVNEPTIFDEGEGELDDAIVDGIGSDRTTRIRYAISAEQLLLFTSRGAYYVGESAEVPISATTWNVNRISSTPAGDCRPVFTDEGVVFASHSRVHTLTQTGNSRQPWVMGDLDQLAGGPSAEDPDEEPIIRVPKKLAFTSELGREKSRYLYVLNEDQTLAVFRHELDSEIGGWTPWVWDEIPAATSITTDSEHHVYAWHVINDGSGTERAALTRFSFDALLDGELDYSTAATVYSGETGLVLTQNGVKLYDGSINGSGEFVRSDNAEVVDPAAGLAVGWDFTTRLIPTPPTNAELGAMVVEVQGVLVKLVDTQSVTVQGETVTSLQGYTQTPDVDDVLPRRTWIPDVITFADSGEDDMREPELVIEQTSAARCTVSPISWRVAYGDG